MTISLLVVFMLSNTELHQFIKLPVLIHHYIEHQSQNANESLLVFLTEHYNENSSHSSENNKDHHNLPFKTHDCTAAHSFAVYTSHPDLSIAEPVTVSSKIPVPANVAFIPSAFLCNIWQPPKIG